MHKTNFVRFLSVRVQKIYLTAVLPIKKPVAKPYAGKCRAEFHPLLRIFTPYRDFATSLPAATHFVLRFDWKDDICIVGIEIITHFSQINYLLSFCRNRRLLPTTACFTFPLTTLGTLSRKCVRAQMARGREFTVVNDRVRVPNATTQITRCHALATPCRGHASPKPTPTAAYRPASVPPSSRVRGWRARYQPIQPPRRLHDGEQPYS